MNDKRYLFRGFHPDENGKTTITLNSEQIRGEWVIGFYHGEDLFMPQIFRGCGGYVVFRETVGQWVTSDKNGKDVFEGDRVLWAYKNQTGKGTIKYNRAEHCYYVEFLDKYGASDGSVFVRKREIEVISNKWEVTE